MTATASSCLDAVIKALPMRYPGPGGAVAVVKDGVVLVRHAWGAANLERRIAFTPQTLVPICSITKQFTCALLLDQIGDPARLDGAVPSWLPRLEGPMPRTIDLCNNQSGLRDYWALTVLCGAAVDGPFRPADARTLIGGTKTLHFAPGTQYSYSNGNFRILADLIETYTGRSFGELLAQRIFGPAGMDEAVFCPETCEVQGDAAGYEGNTAVGFFPAVNRIHWEGDAGISASLDDMIAWERFIDATREDVDGLYRRISREQSFIDGRPASYGFGLAHSTHNGARLTGHGGALRGWRSHRLNAASERLSIIVLFNHSADARGAALDVLSGALGMQAPTQVGQPVDEALVGNFHDPVTDLVLRVASGENGRLEGRFATGPDKLDVADGVARSAAMMLTLKDGGLTMERPGDNLRSHLSPITGAAATDIEGAFRNHELDATFTCIEAGGAFFGAFDGFLGSGALHPLRPVAPDIWLLACSRSMDAPAPGDWTVHFRRNAEGKVMEVTIGSWLARLVSYKRVADERMR